MIMIATSSGKSRLLHLGFKLLLALTWIGWAGSASTNWVGDVQSSGGLVNGSRILTVTSLEDDGTGSLREALKSRGPCVIVFDVSGVIKLQSDLTIAKDQVTIAGETAPSPGIVLYGGSLRIRSSNVVISHIAIFPGATPNPKIAENRDGISLYGSVSKQKRLSGIVLRNVSVGWGVDENIGLQGLTDGVRIERSLIAQPLRCGGHPKGVHAMNLLLGGTVGRVIILGSVFAASEQRSPRLTTGNRVSFLNNLVVATGEVATHLDTSRKILNSGAIDIIGNAYIPGRATKCGRAAIRIDSSFLKADPKTKVYLADNIVMDGEREDCLSIPPDGMAGLSEMPLTQVSGWALLSGRNVPAQILQTAGSHPLHRNSVDKRVVQQIQEGSISIIDQEKDVGGVPSMPEKRQRVDVPIAWGRIETGQDLKRVREWLCGKHRLVSGLYNCP